MTRFQAACIGAARRRKTLGPMGNRVAKENVLGTALVIWDSRCYFQWIVLIPMKTLALLSALGIAVSTALAGSVSGDYLEVRSCDVYTGPCFANAEMNLTGKEGMLLWSVKEGNWNGVDLAGLNVMAVVRANGTLGDLKYNPRTGDTILIVDAKANSAQRQALENFAHTMGGKLISHVVDVKSAPIESSLGTCAKKGCASVEAGDLVEIKTSCLSAKHDICGNEETYYPPLSRAEGAYPVFTELASYNGSGLNVTWQISGKRSAFLGKFSANDAAKNQLAAR